MCHRQSTSNVRVPNVSPSLNSLSLPLSFACAPLGRWAGLDARLLEEVGELAHRHLARARLDLVVVHAHNDAGVAAAEAHTRRALSKREGGKGRGDVGSRVLGERKAEVHENKGVAGAGVRRAAHLLDVDLRVLLATHEHVLDARNRRARRGKARGRSEVRRDGGDLGNLGLLGEGRGGGVTCTLSRGHSRDGWLKMTLVIRFDGRIKM